MSAKGNWTPGPWVIAGSLVLAGSNKSICQIDGAIQIGKPATEEERKANARLIAATPDLLAALVNAQYIIHGFHCGANAPPAWEGRCAKECEEARTAIDKAN